MSTELTTSKGFSLAPTSMKEALDFSQMLAKSTIVPKDYQNNPGNILVAIQWGLEIGLQPMQAMQNISVINGRPSVWGDAMLALVKASPAFEWIREDVSEQEAVCVIKRRGEPEQTRTFSMEDAAKAGLKGKQGPWMQYPKRMMQMRARAWALRDVFPDVLKGMHVAEEAQDMPKDMGSATVIERTPTPASRTASVRERLQQRQATPELESGAASAPAEHIDPATGEILDAEPETPSDELLAALTLIDAAEDLAALEGLASVMTDLPETDKQEARMAYSRRMKALRAVGA